MPTSSGIFSQRVQRQGQPAFRAELLSRYDGKWMVIQETAEAVLEAAHIQPYMGLPSNTMSNGLLLRSDIHTLFDLHLLGIDSEGRVVLSGLHLECVLVAVDEQHRPGEVGGALQDECPLHAEAPGVGRFGLHHQQHAR